MKIKKVGARIARDSRREKTISVYVKTTKGKFVTTSPSGESTGKYEVKPYGRGIDKDIEFIRKLDTDKINISKFEDLKRVERYIGKKLGGDSLYALEASLLKALVKENNKELFEIFGKGKVRIRSVGNAIGGGLHSRGIKGRKPDFQEFFFIAKGKSFKDNVEINERAYDLAHRYLLSWRRNDEGAWETSQTNEGVLEIMDEVREFLKEKGVKVDIGIDIASSAFFNKVYRYENPKREFNSKEQIYHVLGLIKNYDLFYIEDPLNEEDFAGFSKLLKKVKRVSNCLIVGDDLTTTNPKRLRKAIKNKSINAIIVKPNQIGSLVKVKEVIDLSKENNIKTIISHRSGETKDDTIADLGVAFGCDFIKTGINGVVRKRKLRRLIKIEKRKWKKKRQ